MNAARRKGAPRTEARRTMSGQSPPISPLRSIMTVTWLGTMRPVHYHLPASGEVADHGRRGQSRRSPADQNSALSQASRRPPMAPTTSSRAAAGRNRGDDGVMPRAHVYQRVPPSARRGCAPGDWRPARSSREARGRPAAPPARVYSPAAARNSSVAAEFGALEHGLRGEVRYSPPASNAGARAAKLLERGRRGHGRYRSPPGSTLTSGGALPAPPSATRGHARTRSHRLA